MSNNKFVFDGLEELKAELRNLPADLTGEARNIVEDTANGAAVAIRTIYGKHRRTGNLQDNVIVLQSASGGQFGVANIVKSAAPHAWLFDNGSQARHYVTKSGKQHDTGRMWGKTPPTHAFVRTMIEYRHRMYDKLADLLRRHGLSVSEAA